MLGLTNSNNEVRVAAAYALLLNKDVSAIPYLLSAVRKEHNTLDRIHMEAFAAALGSADGLEFLAHDCADKKVRVDARVTAAGDMIHLVHKGGCLPAIVAILTSENDVPSDVVVAALNLLRDSFEEGIPVPQTTLNLIAEYLRSEDAGISTHCDWHAFAPGKQ